MLTSGTLPTFMGAVNPVTSGTVHLDLSIVSLDLLVFPRLRA